MRFFLPVKIFPSLILIGILSCGLALPTRADAKDEESFSGEVGEDSMQGAPGKTPPEAAQGAPVSASGIEGWVRAAKKRMSFAAANIFTSRDVWRGINWFGIDPAYLMGGDFKLDLTPYDEQRLRDIWR